tara:strand:- start:2291 stop:3571 length:1281 start_codon:yes stop_codon:yes gene_type:complete
MFEIDKKRLIIRNKIIKDKKKFTTINITGDCAPIIDEASELMVNKNYFESLLPFFKNGDLNITNLETVIDLKKRKINKNAHKFINKPKILNSLKNININLACLANNHIMDNGDVGLKNTIKYLKKYRINYVGAELSLKKIYKPFFFKKNNHKIAIINTSEGEEANEKYNNHVGSSDIESYKVIDQIRNCKENGYLTILIAHAGVEYIPFPPPYIKDIYKNFVDEGADLVVGHHPHVLQGFEIYKNVPIFYSLGNFTMWKKNLRKNCYSSIFLNIKIRDNKISTINFVPYQIDKNNLKLLSKNKFTKQITELNNFLDQSDRLWITYLKRTNPNKNFFSENLSFFYNFDSYRNNLINKYTNLSKKYSDLDYMKNEFKKDYNFEHILDRWQIKKNKDSLSLFKNIFYPIYKILFIVKKTLINLRSEFFT